MPSKMTGSGNKVKVKDSSNLSDQPDPSLGPSSKLTVLQPLRQWCERTWLNGISEIHGADNCWARMFWMVLVVLALVMVFFQLTMTILDMAQEPHFVSSVYMKNSLKQAVPNLTVCNLNMFNKSAMAALNETDGELSQALISVSMAFAAQINAISTIISPDAELVLRNADPTKTSSKESGAKFKSDADLEFKGVLKEIMKSEQIWRLFYQREDVPNTLKNPKQLMHLAGHLCRETFISCSVSRVSFDCCENVVKTVINHEYGLCYYLQPPARPSDPGGLRHQDFPGQAFGISLTLDPSMESYTNQMRNSAMMDGLVLELGDDPDRMFFLDPIILSPGTLNHINIRRLTQFTESSKFSLYTPNCVTNAKLKLSSAKYNQFNCVFDCVQELVHAFCDCVLAAEVQPWVSETIGICNATKLATCFDGIGIAFGRYMRGEPAQDLESEFSFEKCVSGCKPPCEKQIDVQYNARSVSYPATRIVPQFQNYAKLRKWNTNVTEMIVVDIYFGDTLETFVNTHEALTLVTFLSNLGGQLGLWLGASILGIIQMFYYLAIFVWRFASNLAMYPQK